MLSQAPLPGGLIKKDGRSAANVKGGGIRGWVHGDRGQYVAALFEGCLLYTSNALAWVVAVVFAFVTNKQFVFESKSWKLKSTLKEAIGFTGGRVVTLLLEQGGMLLFVEAIHMNENLAKAILAVIVVILNYVFSKLWVFVRKDVCLLYTSRCV